MPREVQEVGNRDEVVRHAVEVEDDVCAAVRQHRAGFTFDEDDDCSRGVLGVPHQVGRNPESFELGRVSINVGRTESTEEVDVGSDGT